MTKAATERQPDNSDLWAAIRGLGMYRMTRDELRDIVCLHEGSPLFASRVIMSAALHVYATRPRHTHTEGTESDNFIAYLESCSADDIEETIDKAHRRGAISDFAAWDARDYFDLITEGTDK